MGRKAENSDAGRDDRYWKARGNTTLEKTHERAAKTSTNVADWTIWPCVWRTGVL